MTQRSGIGEPASAKCSHGLGAPTRTAEGSARGRAVPGRRYGSLVTCSLLPLASALHDRRSVERLLDGLEGAVDTAGALVVHDVTDAPTDAPLAVLVLTGGTERQVLDAWSARQLRVPGEPLLLVTHPEHNSLPAALEALARLQQEGARGRIVMVRDGGGEALAAAIHDVRVWHSLHRARIGLLGRPSDWLVASSTPPEAVRRRWGPTVVELDIEPALTRQAVATEAPLAVPVRLGARHIHEPSEADVETAARFEPVLRDIAASERLDAVSVRCFDLVLESATSGCLALSALNDEGVIAGCEGDVASTLGLLWVRELTGRLGWMANPAVADPRTGVVELAHCTVPRSLVSGYELRSHFESGLGVGIAGDLPPGPVTLVRLGGAELEQLWCVDGEALPTTPREGRCRTQLDVRVDPEAVARLLERPLGNHLVVVGGHHAEQLGGWWHAMVEDLP